MIEIAGVQCDVVFADPAANLRRMEDFVRQAARDGARLVVFPECVLTGYCFESLAEALPCAEPIPGPATEAMQRVCAECDVHVIFGMLERADPAVYNAAVLVGPRGVVASYRKIHLPYLGVDMFTTHGDRPFAVDTIDDRQATLRIGMNICYDASFPESTRSLMLLGADLVALPTNWPPGSQCVAELAIRCRALENAVYFLAVNRVGTERGFVFIGQSQLIDPAGRVMQVAAADREEIIHGSIDVARARQKHVVRVPGAHEIDRFADRRPEFYGGLVQPHDAKGPGRG